MLDSANLPGYQEELLSGGRGGQIGSTGGLRVERLAYSRTDLLTERGLQLGELLLDQIRIRFSLLKTFLGLQLAK